MNTLNNVFLMLRHPTSSWKNTACLVTYLIATGHHLWVRFPLLVFQAQTRLISWLTLIRGHISEHSGVSCATCWKKWNAINQSGLLYNTLASGNKQNADWVSDAEMRVFAVHRKMYQNQSAIVDVHLWRSSLRSSEVRRILIRASKLN